MRKDSKSKKMKQHGVTMSVAPLDSGSYILVTDPDKSGKREGCQIYGSNVYTSEYKYPCDYTYDIGASSSEIGFISDFDDLVAGVLESNIAEVLTHMVSPEILKEITGRWVFIMKDFLPPNPVSLERLVYSGISGDDLVDEAWFAIYKLPEYDLLQIDRELILKNTLDTIAILRAIVISKASPETMPNYNTTVASFVRKFYKLTELVNQTGIYKKEYAAIINVLGIKHVFLSSNYISYQSGTPMSHLFSGLFTLQKPGKPYLGTFIETIGFTKLSVETFEQGEAILSSLDIVL